MFSCLICLDPLKDPAALPCGHVFCHPCILRLAQSMTPFTTQQLCPTCRRPYAILPPVDPSLVPTEFRQHVPPPVRKLYLDNPSYEPPQNTDAGSTECAQLKSEIASLQLHCDLWRKRAEAHGKATLSFIDLARIARDDVVQMRKERDMLQHMYDDLRSKFGETEYAGTSPSPRNDFDADEAIKYRPAKRARKSSPASSLSTRLRPQTRQ